MSTLLPKTVNVPSGSLLTNPTFTSTPPGGPILSTSSSTQSTQTFLPPGESNTDTSTNLFTFGTQTVTNSDPTSLSMSTSSLSTSTSDASSPTNVNISGASHHTVPPGAIAGAVVGGVAALLIAAVAAFLLFRSCARNRPASKLGGQQPTLFVTSPRSSRSPKSPKHKEWANLGSVDSTHRSSPADLHLADANASRASSRGGLVNGVGATGMHASHSSVAMSDEDMRTVEAGSSEGTDKLGTSYGSSVAGGGILSGVQSLEYGVGYAVDDDKYESYAPPAPPTPRAQAAPHSQAIAQAQAAARANRRRSSGSSVTMVVGDHRYSGIEPTATATATTTTTNPPPTAARSQHRLSGYGAPTPTSPTYPPVPQPHAYPTRHHASHSSTASPVSPVSVAPTAAPHRKPAPVSPAEGQGQGQGQGQVQRSNSARRTARKPVPRYDSADLRSAAPPVSPPPPDVGMLGVQQQQQVERRPSADRLAAEGGGPVYHLMPDLPVAQRD